MSSFGFLNGVRVLGVQCLQWGDSGKGKLVHWLSEWADVIVRCYGGANAGHTVVDRDLRWVQRLLPCGIAYDKDGKINVIGSGVAFDPTVAVEEIAMLQRLGITCRNLMISHRAKLVLPQHVLLDKLREHAAGGSKIGTTGRGIGPTFGDFRDSRNGLFVNDLLNRDVFVRKLRINLEQKRRLLGTYDPEVVRAVMHEPILGSGAFYDAATVINVDAVVEHYLQLGQQLNRYVRDTDTIVQAACVKQRILLEGAQGYLLGVEEGTYPFVTSSDCTSNGLARGAGLNERDIDLVLGTTKGFYTTRVGMGPFVTEHGREVSAQWCSNPNVTEANELIRYPDASVNSPDEFEQGVALRRVAREYGAVTARPRRTGWVDVPLLRRALRHTGRTELALMRLDMLDGFEQIKLCTEHRYGGPSYVLGEFMLEPGVVFREATVDAEVLGNMLPTYEVHDGWCAKTSDARSWEDLPAKLRWLVRRLEQLVGCRARILSVGPDREQTIVVE